MQQLSKQQLQQIHGGHDSSGTLMFILGIPHVVMGVIEFYNYFADWYKTGCNSSADNDHFKKLFCSIPSNDTVDNG